MDTTIYMPLLNEGTVVWRPIVATALGNSRYSFTGVPSNDEEWAFASDTIVMVDGDGRIIGEVTD